MKWMGHMACMGEDRSACRVLVRKPEGKGQCRKFWHRWEENITMYVNQIGWEGIDWICLA
jgi:hypothetical protein